MIGVDTGFFLALSQPRDRLHDRAKAWAAIISDRLLVTEYILCETVNGLSQPVDRPKAHALIRHIRTSASYDIVPASADLFEKGLELHESRPDKEWSLTDCISFLVLADRRITQVLAHDHHYEQAGFEALLRRDPP
jgi:uncharacterized protein